MHDIEINREFFQYVFTSSNIGINSFQHWSFTDWRWNCTFVSCVELRKIEKNDSIQMCCFTANLWNFNRISLPVHFQCSLSMERVFILKWRIILTINWGRSPVRFSSLLQGCKIESACTQGYRPLCALLFWITEQWTPNMFLTLFHFQLLFLSQVQNSTTNWKWMIDNNIFPTSAKIESATFDVYRSLLFYVENWNSTICTWRYCPWNCSWKKWNFRGICKQLDSSS